MSDRSSGDVRVGGNVSARDVITGIQQNFNVIFQVPFEPPPDLETLRADYLACLRDSFSKLDIKGILQVQRVAPSMPLAAVYVPLKARSQRLGAGEDWMRVAGRWMCAGEGPIDGLPRAGGQLAHIAGRSAAPVPVEEALQSEPAVVVLGDPGAGKSTLLKVLTLALAEQPDGPLPILLPLNAYARRLQNGAPVNLCDFLGQHYAMQRKNLAQVGALFEAALQDGPAVILLDGLDEVQDNRSYLVNLVQQFVDEWVPEPVEGDETVSGNRVVVTSRVVGYDKAPLVGEHWRTYSLTDFDRDDIERFVRRWTWAFEVGVHGGETDTAIEAAERERDELLEAVFSRPSVERLAVNPLLLTILALIKRTGVLLPEQRVKLYELYLEALIESWNLARSLDLHSVGPRMSYLDTVQVLAPLALWLRETNPSAGLVTRADLENWLVGYYRREWALPPGEARQRGRELLEDVQSYSNLLLERGEGQYGFLHLTLEEMLAAKGVAQVADEDGVEKAGQLMTDHLADPAWRETLLLAVGAVGVIQQRPAAAGKLLMMLLESEAGDVPRGANVVLAGEALLDVGETGVQRPVAGRVTRALVEIMRSPDCHIRERRDAGVVLGRLGWRPEPEEGDLILAPDDPSEPSGGLDAFRRVGEVWVGKYPVTNGQYARFVRAGGYDDRHWWTKEGWAWRTGRYDSNASEYLQDWLKGRPPERRNLPFWWRDRSWNSPLQPVVGVTWFESLAYCAWLAAIWHDVETRYIASLPPQE